MRKFLAPIGFVPLKDILAVTGAGAILVGIAAVIFFFGGFFSVATTAPEPAIMDWALISVRTASIARHATARPPAGFEDAAGVKAGAKVYNESGCTNCHGGPGVEWARFSEGLRPDAPDLKAIGQQLTSAEIFWVIKHGINMTGMPEFGSIPEKDIWSVVAFVKKMPEVKDDEFKSWTSVTTAAK